MKVVGLQTFIWKNNFRSLLLLLLFPAILALIIFLIIFGVIVADGEVPARAVYSSAEVIQLFAFHILGATALWFVIAWLFNRQMILAMTKSRPLDRSDNRRVYDIVERLAISRGISTPKLYIIDDESMNAFASGLSPNSSLISFSKGIITSLTDAELEAVAAHEMTHILNRDIRLMVICIIFVGIIQTVSEVFLRTRINIKSDRDSGNAFLIMLAIKVVVFIIGFLFTIIIQMAISRKREYLADAGAVELTKTSEPLISALRKISGDARIEAIENRSVAQMCIENPLAKVGRASFFDKIFSTHPQIEDRIAALEMVG